MNPDDKVRRMVEILGSIPEESRTDKSPCPGAKVPGSEAAANEPDCEYLGYDYYHLLLDLHDWEEAPLVAIGAENSGVGSELSPDGL
jgi:hypothetical protein